MYNFILQTVIVVALGAMIYLVARALPRVPAPPAAGEAAPRIRTADILERLMARLPLQKLDAATSSFLEKFLRRVRLIVLKFDNWIHASIKKVKAANGSATSVSVEVPASVETTAGKPAEASPSSPVKPTADKPSVIKTPPQAVEKPEDGASPPQTMV